MPISCGIAGRTPDPKHVPPPRTETLLVLGIQATVKMKTKMKMKAKTKKMLLQVPKMERRLERRTAACRRYGSL